MNRIKFYLFASALALAQGAGLASAQQQGTVVPPDPLIMRPGGDGNKSQYEYTPENQPSWSYQPPANAEDACVQESALLRDKARDMEEQILLLQQQVADLTARNDALQRKASGN